MDLFKQPTANEAPSVEELLKLAAELQHYSTTMPTDAFARRWHIIAMALVSQANSMVG
jgi:hypothetical protein